MFSVRKQIIIASGVVLTTLLAIIAYQLDKSTAYGIRWFWAYYDGAWLSISCTFFYAMHNYHIIAGPIMLLIACVCNSFLVSIIGDYQVMGIDQHIAGYIFAGCVFAIGVSNIMQRAFHYRQREKCARDARNKYRMINNRLDQTDEQFKDIVKKIEDVFTRITTSA